MHVDWMDFVGPTLVAFAAMLRGVCGQQPTGSFFVAALMLLSILLSIPLGEGSGYIVSLPGAALLIWRVASSMAWKAKQGDTRFSVRNVLRCVIPLTLVLVATIFGITHGSLAIRAVSCCLLALIMIAAFVMGARKGACSNGSTVTAPRKRPMKRLAYTEARKLAASYSVVLSLYDVIPSQRVSGGEMVVRPRGSLVLAGLVLSATANANAPAGLGTVLSVGTYGARNGGIKSVQLVTWKRSDGVVCHQYVSDVATGQAKAGAKPAFVTDTACDDDHTHK